VKEYERSIGMLAFIFSTEADGYTRFMLHEFWREGVTVNDGNHHGVVVCDQNSYVYLDRLMYHRGYYQEIICFPNYDLCE